MLKGIAASPGLVIGKAYLVGDENVAVPKRKVPKEELPLEIARFEEALIKTRSEIIEIKNKIIEELGHEHGEIFDAHLLVLEDRALIEEVISYLKKDRYSVEYAFSQVLERYISAFIKIDDEYLRERLSDIQDVGRRILHNLLGGHQALLKDLRDEVVLVAYDLSPSDTASMPRDKILAFVTDIGGRTSHTAIMARSLEIPAVIGIETATKDIRNGDIIIVDGSDGLVYVNPDKDIMQRYKKSQKKRTALTRELVKIKDLPAETKDGYRIQLSANIEFPEEIASVQAHGAHGIGLYRTEYFYMNRAGLPTEDEHFEAYKKVAERMKPEMVIIRTMDLGGDKFISQLEIPREMNPFLGWRAIRFCLARPELFKIQLRAILRASVFGNLMLMYPMISGVEEIKEANKILKSCKRELEKENVNFNKDLKVGAMIEIPSAALTADVLAEEVDFFSIGTNDLIQYSMAVDRSNEKIAYLYNPAHPAVLRLIRNVINAGHQKGIWVGMCGEMAADPAMALLLVGMGLDEFSVSSISVPTVKKIIRSISLKEAQDIAKQALKLTSGDKIRTFLNDKAKEIIPELLSLKDK
ncbi:MAG: phosphoenolpyruvate--protein phosphotransferase [Candidatus Kappaea frigidicola]|nr:phosphoenolpyruvate--protein phosphotransferase [Candidatus Kappaea frigidicola]